MRINDIANPLFREAVAAIDAGNMLLLQRLLAGNPQLISQRLNIPEEGYFAHPYLLWFIADNPIRNKTLPANIMAVTQLLIDNIQRFAPEILQDQLDYTLALVATGRTPRDCGFQLPLMDVLINAGAKTGNGHSALAHGNTAAARHLLERGGPLTLATAVCLDREEDMKTLAATAESKDFSLALVTAAFYGQPEKINWLLHRKSNPNEWPDPTSGFHSHATALHQAVSSGSLACVQLLAAAGARLDAKDKIYQGTPLDWARHLQQEEKDPGLKANYAAIEQYLSNRQAVVQ